MKGENKKEVANACKFKTSKAFTQVKALSTTALLLAMLQLSQELHKVTNYDNARHAGKEMIASRLRTQKGSNMTCMCL
ncbi:hypothetical protein QOT17_021845 [Balamuthia mandrillaris]